MLSNAIFIRYRHCAIDSYGISSLMNYLSLAKVGYCVLVESCAIGIRYLGLNLAHLEEEQVSPCSSIV